jgi:hypothetical protein
VYAQFSLNIKKKYYTGKYLIPFFIILSFLLFICQLFLHMSIFGYLSFYGLMPGSQAAGSYWAGQACPPPGNPSQHTGLINARWNQFFKDIKHYESLLINKSISIVSTCRKQTYTTTKHNKQCHFFEGNYQGPHFYLMV